MKNWITFRMMLEQQKENKEHSKLVTKQIEVEMLKINKRNILLDKKNKIN